MQLKSKFLIFLMTLLVTAPNVIADEPLKAIEMVASKDVLAIAWVDLDSVQLSECIGWASEQGIVDSRTAEEINAMTGMAQELIGQVSEAGVDHVFAVIHQEDLLFRAPPLVVFSVSDVEKIEKTFRSLRRILSLLQLPEFELEVWNGTILGGTKDQIARVKAEPSIPRPRLSQGWERLGGHDAGAMLFGSSDTRRVLREMFPALDAPFENITGKMIADDIDSIGCFIGLPTDIDGKLIVQTSGEETAKSLKSAAESALGLLLEKDGEFANLISPAVLSAVSELKPEVKSNELIFDLQPILSDKVKLLQLFEPIAAGSRETQRYNNLRQIILAMLNYESAHKLWPAYANFDDDGKPLLSWRVHILPFIERGQLYNEFRLDEPWDSPHNIKLVKKMPEVYADPSLEFANLKEAGKTRYLVPYAEGTIFYGKEGVSFGDIKDGSSNTIALVAADPEIAVVWTKPADWKVDLDNPKKGLFSKSIAEVKVAYADGSAVKYRKDADKAKLRALLTKDGGEIPGEVEAGLMNRP